MTRLLLILALVCTGLAPSASCLHAAVSVDNVVAAECAMACCGPACCCVGESTPTDPAPEAPATPPRGTDTVPTVLLLPSPYVLAWDDLSIYPRLEAAAVSREGWRSPRAVQTMICRWLT